jgi:hypothetical protein
MSGAHSTLFVALMAVLMRAAFRRLDGRRRFDEHLDTNRTHA